jgi:spermidine/putrescine transport system substrate-binding protein
VAAQVALYVKYLCPVQGAQVEMERLDPVLAENVYVFPSAEDLAKVKRFRTLTSAEETQFDAQFQAIVGG